MNRQLSKKEERLAVAVFCILAFFLFIFTFNRMFDSYTADYDSALPAKSISGFSMETVVEQEDFDTRLDRLLKDVGADSSVAVKSVPNACGTGESLGCVMALDANTIQILSSMRYMDDDSLKALLAHELAHVITNKFTPLMEWGYLAVFEHDSEYVADCMAVQRVGFTVSDYGYTCSSDQLDTAAEIWEWHDSIT